MDQKFYKVMKENEIHYGFKYQEGLNIDTEPFREIGCCVSGGLYFTTSKHIHKFFKYGKYIREVFLPLDNPDFKMVGDPCGDRWRANMLILGKKYPLDHVMIYYNLCKDPGKLCRFENAMKLYNKKKKFDRFIANHNIILETDKLYDIIFETPKKINKGGLIIMKNYLINRNIEINVTDLIKNNNFEDIIFLQENGIKIKHNITKNEYHQLPSYIICCMITFNLYQSIFNLI